MKKKLAAAIVFISLVFSAQAQKAENGKVVITGSRFTYPLLEKWIAEFKKKYPEVPFTIIPRGSTNNLDSTNLIINAHVLSEDEIRPGFELVNIGIYAILPVANSKNPYLKEIEAKGLREKELSALFFKKYEPFVNAKTAKDKKAKQPYKPNLYTRQELACAPTTFARKFGFHQDDILGKKILGDDKYMITAVEKDTNGITYNNLGAIYDLKTRKIKPNLTVLPLDLNGNNKIDEDEKFYSNLDQVIDKLEKNKYSLIPTEYVNISYPSQINDSNRNTQLFLSWVLEDGQQYNHEYGFLNFEKEKLDEQKSIVYRSQK